MCTNDAAFRRVGGVLLFLAGCAEPERNGQRHFEVIDLGCDLTEDFKTHGDGILAQAHRRFLNPDGTAYWKPDDGSWACEANQVGWRFTYVYD